jgi:hypothetical protein
MTLSEFENKRFEQPLKNYCANKYPAHIRNELHLDYRIKDQSIILFTVRPQWNNPSETVESMIAKATYVKNKKIWKLYWQRADMKWHGYEPEPEVRSVEEFLEIVEADKYACFYG